MIVANSPLMVTTTKGTPMSPMALQAECFSIYEIARKFHLSPETVRLWIVRGLLINGGRVQLAALKVGGQWRIYEDNLIDFLHVIRDTPKPSFVAPAVTND